jgi:predicted nucleic acid-binding protein
VVPLVVAEAETRACRRLFAEDAEVVVWCLTPVEVVSALARRLRENMLKLTDFRKAKGQLALLERAWSEVTLIQRVRELARLLLERHPLRAADALQLAAAIVVSEPNPQSVPFVTLDQRLGAIAEMEGFPVLGS